MKNKYSLISCVVISIVIIAFRFEPTRYEKEKPLLVTTWDALGYYLYLPSIFIYNDFKELAWFPEIDQKYSVSGGKVYQAGKSKSGHYVFKYLGGVAILESPFFITGHLLASKLGYPTDGFSPPYQFAIVFGAMFYCILSLFLLRKILLMYFNDSVTSVSLLLLFLATNIIQYISVDGAMSHSFIFFLYVLILYFTIKWHLKPSILWASLIGAVIGLATISRPTEAIMLFIPLLWSTQSKEKSAEKWKLVKQYKSHLYFLALFGFLAVLPQLIYWKAATGSFVYDVGSKWHFLSPHFKVLFGWESGWFIYTPVVIFFIVGMFMIKKFPFRKSVITFCLLNIYIIIAWSDWRYGASYSCRALTQSYPVFALPLAAFISKINSRTWRYLFYTLGLYLIIINIFQLVQYNRGILHYYDMNRKYYSGIYLNPDPSPVVMSLLDTDERLNERKSYNNQILLSYDSIQKINVLENAYFVLYESEVNQNITNANQNENWYKFEASIKINSTNPRGCFLISELILGDSVKQNKIRIPNANSKPGAINDYAFYVNVPAYFEKGNVKLYFKSGSAFDGELRKITIQHFTN
jgi:hypothetical protein